MSFIKTSCEEPENIRAFLKSKGFSTSLIAKVKLGGCFINGDAVHMRASVGIGDKVEIIFPDEMSEGIPPIDLPLDIIYEDDWILAVNKPRNMPIHPSLGNSLPTVANLVMHYIGAPFVFRAVNRLDRDTSGIVLIAKNQLSGGILSRSIKQGEVTKHYLAVVDGALEGRGRIDAPIEREEPESMRRIVCPNGKPSITEYEVLGPAGNGKTLVQVLPITGRTHQIRVHFAHIGHPLSCDFLYGKRREGETYRLHCVSLGFKHPISKEDIILTAEPPVGFTDL